MDTTASEATASTTGITYIRALVKHLPGTGDSLFGAVELAAVGKRIGCYVQYPHHKRPLKRQLPPGADQRPGSRPEYLLELFAQGRQAKGLVRERLGQPQHLLLGPHQQRVGPVRRTVNHARRDGGFAAQREHLLLYDVGGAG
jgi:hypothetical protein